jgi:2,3-bisphosphoglycerate-independent phosphoglycerate mutase
MTTIQHRPMVLLIFDGFGHSESKAYNAIQNANTPNFDSLWKNYAHTLISGSGEGVGLPDGQMGNSEVGHLNLGAGRIVYQEYTRISKAIEDKSFFENPIFNNNIDATIQKEGAIHIMGLVSPGGVHSHVNHILAMIELAAERGAESIYIHAFLDGRDTPPQSAADSIQLIENKCKELKKGKIVSLIGRYYAMDRDSRWNRVEKSYNLLTTGEAEFHSTTALEGLQAAYDRDETDEFVKATSIHANNQNPVTINGDDTVIFMNFRADRTRELTRAFIEKDFSEFKRKKHPALTAFICLTQYHADFNTPVAFTPSHLNNVLGEYLSKLGLRQLRIAETEKYAHVTFFFNGGVETPFKNEDRQLIPSPNVATYDLQPEMSAPELTEALTNAIESQNYDCIICNFANADMVGHTGNYDAAIKAIECLDSCLGKITSSLEKVGGEAIITADHGNADCMFNEKTKQKHTAHTTNPVPFIYVGRSATIANEHALLSDITPTILYLMGLEPPKEMTGTSIVKLAKGKTND